jgi:pimeloyl-ACP methyl ester carboxylesterase
VSLSPSSRRILAATAVVATGALLAACTGTVGSVRQASPSPSTSDGSPAPSSSATGVVDPSLAEFYTQQIRWAPCGGSFQCGKLTVPIDYADPSGDTTELALIKLATRAGDRIGSLVLNPGGPGGSGVDYARAARVVVDDSVRARYDIVGFDPRGVQRSAPVNCLDDPTTDSLLALDGTPDDDADVAALEAVAKKLADGCKADAPKLYAHIGTVEVAKDVDILRAALGDEKLYWLGASYGTLIGATYADLFPTRVGRMVLDGAIDPTLTNVELAHGQAKGFELALRRFVEDCVTQSDCPLPRDVQGGMDRIEQFFADLETEPLSTGDAKRPLTQALGQNSVLFYLYVPPTDWEQLRFGLQAAFDGDGSVLLSMLDARVERSESGSYATNSLSALYAVNALDRPDRPTAAESAKLAAQWALESPVFGAFLAWGNLPFQYWDAPATGSPHAISAPGSPPILVVGTTYDPATPYPWAQALATQLSKGVLLTRVGDGHTGYGSGSQCTDSAIDRYLVDGVAPPAGTVCR